MKKTIIKLAVATAVTLSTSAAFAQNNQYDGLYMGVDASYDKLAFKSYEVDSLTDLEPTDTKSIYDDEGAAAGIFIGYRLSDWNFTLAAEARYGYSFIENILASDNTFKLTNEFGASILPGYWISPETILFTRFGFSQLTANRVSNGIVNEGSDSGLHFGAGIEFFINETMSFRGEYNRSTYMHEMSEIVSDTSTDPATDVQVDFRNKFRRDRFQVSMVARF